MKFTKSHEITGLILNATIRQDSSSKYFVPLLVETDVHDLPKTGSFVGVDVI